MPYDPVYVSRVLKHPIIPSKKKEHESVKSEL